MDKNIAALMRQDTKTVRVSFDQVAEAFDDIEPVPSKRYATQPPKPPQSKLYTYVTHLPLAIGDTVVVEARGALQIAFVRQVDEDVAIEPNADTAYKWVVSKVDLSSHAENVARNQEIETLVSDAYRHNLRRSFSQQILSGIDDANRVRVAALIGVNRG